MMARIARRPQPPRRPRCTRSATRAHCVALFQEGKFTTALTACHAGGNLSPPELLHDKLVAMMARIKAEAKAQRIDLELK